MMLAHGTNLARRFPRMTMNRHLPLALETTPAAGPDRFACVGDTTCDIESRLEFLRGSRRSASSSSQLAAGASTPGRVHSRRHPARGAPEHFSNALVLCLRSVMRSCRDEVPRDDAERVAVEALERVTVAQGERIASEAPLT